MLIGREGAALELVDSCMELSKARDRRNDRLMRTGDGGCCARISSNIFLYLSDLFRWPLMDSMERSGKNCIKYSLMKPSLFQESSFKASNCNSSEDQRALLLCVLSCESLSSRCLDVM